MKRAASLFTCWSLVSFCCVQPALASTAIALPYLSPAPSSDKIDSTWKGAAGLSLAIDFNNHRAAAESTEVLVGQQNSSIDIAFIVHQREPVLATQVTDGPSVTSDDYVVAYMWPQGTQGFAYSFAANARGARYQTSSENTAYTPQWYARGYLTTYGYDVIMEVPINAIRSGGSHQWRIQFCRRTVSTNALAVWTYSGREQVADDPAFAGIVNAVNSGTAHRQVKTPARLQTYALGEATTPANGGSTSRMGADFSIPVTATASVFGTFHPDYSNVEIDQQTIAPNPFAYQYQEVRPFFTQASAAYNNTFSCNNCPTLLYTPAIPTFREGYAAEGTQGPLTFAAFDAIGDGRSDNSFALDYQVENSEDQYAVNLQRSAVDISDGLQDDTTSISSGIQNRSTHFYVYENAAFERGSLISSPDLGNYLETGIGYGSATANVIASYESIGAEFSPVDGFVAQSDITGYELFASKKLVFPASSFLQDIYAQVYAGRFHNHLGEPSQIDLSEQVNFDLRDLLTLHIYDAYSGIETISAGFLPFNANGFELGYRLNTNTPSYLQYTGGAYYNGRLNSWTYLTTLPISRNAKVQAELDEVGYLAPSFGEPSVTQWLERASFEYQIGRNCSFDIGVRRIIGRYIPNSFEVPTFSYVDAGNVAAAFHLFYRRDEFFLVYGNPNSVATTPALILKWIHYVGAAKGT